MSQIHQKPPVPNFIRHPRLVAAVVLAALLIHPSAIATALFGFASAIIVAEAIDYVLKGE